MNKNLKHRNCFGYRVSKLPKKFSNALKFLTHSSSDIGYIGWLGYRNLGDEVLYQTISELLSPALLFHYVPTPLETRLLRFLKPTKKFRAICLGGGTLIGDLNYLNVIRDSLSHNIPVFSFGTGVRDPSFWEDNFGFNLHLDDWAKALSGFEAISVRGYLSARILKQLGVKNVTVIGDPLIALAKETLSDSAEDLVLGVNIGHPINGYSWSMHKSYYVDEVVKNLRLLAAKGWRFRLFSVVPDDISMHDHLKERIGSKNVQVSKFYNSPREFMADAESCCVFLGSKLHSTLLAYAALTPVIMLEYQPKCKDFMFTMDLIDYNIRIDQLARGVIVELVEKARYYSKSLREHQLSNCKEYKQKLQMFARRIISIIG